MRQATSVQSLFSLTITGRCLTLHSAKMAMRNLPTRLFQVFCSACKKEMPITHGLFPSMCAAVLSILRRRKTAASTSTMWENLLRQSKPPPPFSGITIRLLPGAVISGRAPSRCCATHLSLARGRTPSRWCSRTTTCQGALIRAFTTRLSQSRTTFIYRLGYSTVCSPCSLSLRSAQSIWCRVLYFTGSRIILTATTISGSALC